MEKLRNLWTKSARGRSKLLARLRALSNPINNRKSSGAYAFVYQWILPITLLGASVSRVSAVSYIYLLCFLCNILWMPHRLLQARKSFGRALATFIFFISGAVCVGHIVFQSLYHIAGLSESTRLDFIGFPMIQTSNEAARYILPDIAVMIISTLLLILFQNGHIFSQRNFDRPTHHQLPAVNDVAILCMLFLIGISFSSFMHLVFFMAFLIMLLYKGLMAYSINTVIEKSWIWLLIYTTLDIIVIYTFQIPMVRDNSSFKGRQIFGLYHYTEFKPSFDFIGLAAGWGATVLLFVLLAYRFREFMVVKLFPAPFQTKTSAWYSTHLNTGVVEKEEKVQKFLGRHGRKICHVALLIVALLVPSFLGFVLLLAIFVGAVSHHEQLDRVKFLPSLSCYFAVWIGAQYLFNLPINDGNSPGWATFGLVKFDAIWLWLGLQCLAFYILILTCYHRGVYDSNFTEGEDDLSDSESHQLQSLPSKPEEQEQEEEAEEGDNNSVEEKNETLKSSLSIKGESGLLANMLSEEHIGKGKRAFEAFTQWILENSYKLSLAGLYMASLATINLIRAGYLIIFILFAVFPRFAKRFWFVLVLYCFLVVSLVYSWNLYWTPEADGPMAEVIGLYHFNHRDLVFEGLLYHLIILLFAIIQWQLIAFVNKKKREAMEKEALSPRRQYFVVAAIQHVWQEYGLTVCYFVVYIAAITTQLSISNMVYLVFTFTCLLIHMKTRDAPFYISKFWIILVLYSGLVLISRYIYQFDQFSSWLQSVYPANDFISLEDLGLYKFDEPLFWRLLGNSGVFLFSVIQYKAFIYGPETREYRQVLEKSIALPHVINIAKRFLVIHAQKLTIIVAFIVVLSPISALNVFYLLLVLVLMPLTSGLDDSGFFLMIYSMLLTLAQMAYQFPSRAIFEDTTVLKWIGLLIEESTFKLVGGYAAIILCVMMSRVARRWKHDYMAQMSMAIDNISTTDSHDFSVDELTLWNAAPAKYEITLFNYAPRFAPTLTGKFHRAEFKEGAKWYLSNLFNVSFYQVTLIVLVIAVLVRYNVFAVGYLLLLGVCVTIPRHVFETRVFQFAVSLILMLGIMFQYALNLGVPTNLAYAPWRVLPESWQYWLGIQLPNSYHLLVDFLLYFVFVHIYKLQPGLEKLRSSQYWQSIIECTSVIEDFARHSRYWTNSLKFNLFRYSQYFVLVIVFVFATVQADALSVGYVLFSLLYLYAGHEFFRRRDSLWQWSRYYNYFVLMARLAYQVPILEGSTLPEAWQNIVGFRKRGEATDWVVFDYMIFLLLHAQRWFYSRPEFDLVVQVMELEEQKATVLAVKKYIEYKERKQKELDQLQKQKARRKAQLETLRECRQRQNELWTMIEQRGQAAIIHATANPQSVSQDSVSQQQALSDLVIDIKRLQTLSSSRLSITLPSDLAAQQEQTKEEQKREEEEQKQKEIQSEIFVALESDSDSESDSSLATSREVELNISLDSLGKSREVSASDHGGSLIIEEPLVDAHPKKNKSKVCCETPEPIANAADKLIYFLDQLSYSHHKHLYEYNRSSFAKIAIGLQKVSQRYSQYLVFVLMMFTAVVHANILAIVLPITMFLYALLEKPRPHTNYWRFVILYLDFVLVVKFIYQFTVFCDCQANEGHLWDMQPHCSEPTCNIENDARLFSTPYLVGVYKFNKAYILAAFWDLVTLLSVLFHRHNLKKHGLWNFTKPPDLSNKKKVEEEEKERTSSDIEDPFPMSSDARRTPQFISSAPTTPRGRSNSDPIQPMSSIDLETGTMPGLLSRRSSLLSSPGSAKSGEFEDIPLDAVRWQNMPQHQERNCFAGFTLMIRRHFGTLVMIKVGRDVYPAQFIAEIICFFFLLLIPGDFTGGEGGNIIHFILENRLPTIYVMTILVQFIFILVERVLFLYRAKTVKLLWHYAMVIFYHVYLIFYMPYINNLQFTASPAFIIFYMLKLAYLFTSGLQLYHGYPSVPQGRFLTDEDHPGIARRIVFMVFRAIPFLWELSTLLDWTTTTTALSFFEWLKLEDLYDDMFDVLCRIEHERRTERRPGDKQPWWIKVLIGLGLFILLVTVIWFPLLALMEDAPGNQPNSVRYFGATISFDGYGPLYDAWLSTDDMTNTLDNKIFELMRHEYVFLSKDDQHNMQIMNMTLTSGDVWSITAPSLQSLIARLERGAPTRMTYQFTFRRDLPKDHLELSTKGYKILTSEEMASVLGTLQGRNESFVIQNLFPRFFRLPVSNQISVLGFRSYVSVMFKLVTSEYNITVNGQSVPQYMRYWSVQEADPEGFFASEELTLAAVSNVVSTSLSLLSAKGIIGLYVGVVLTVGRFVRLALTKRYTRIMFTDMNEVEELRTFCKDIFLARQDKDLELEESLYRELIELYRSPERLILRTLPKKPRFKEPKEPKPKDE